MYEFYTGEPKEVLPVKEYTLGLDYSSPLFYVDSTGHAPGIPHWFRQAEEKLALYQRQLSRMTYGSKNHLQQLHKIQLLHEHIASQRKDFVHQESRRITNAWNTACVEDIDLRAMAGRLHLGKSANDNGFGMFRTFLEYKLQEQGKHLIRLNRWYPSSKTCHNCGYIHAELTLNDREWVCPSCGQVIPRDLNAALNIRDASVDQFYAVPA